MIGKASMFIEVDDLERNISIEVVGSDENALPEESRPNIGFDECYRKDACISFSMMAFRIGKFSMGALDHHLSGGHVRCRVHRIYTAACS